MWVVVRLCVRACVCGGGTGRSGSGGVIVGEGCVSLKSGDPSRSRVTLYTTVRWCSPCRDLFDDRAIKGRLVAGCGLCVSGSPLASTFTEYAGLSARYARACPQHRERDFITCPPCGICCYFRDSMKHEHGYGRTNKHGQASCRRLVDWSLQISHGGSVAALTVPLFVICTNARLTAS